MRSGTAVRTGDSRLDEGVALYNDLKSGLLPVDDLLLEEYDLIQAVSRAVEDIRFAEQEKSRLEAKRRRR